MADLDRVFAELRAILLPYAKGMDCTADTGTNFYLNTKHLQPNKKPLFFGAVQLKKSYVSYHLMPLYTAPALIASVSPGLKKRMQGKSCFNFSAPDTELFKEIAAVTKAGFREYKKAGYV